MRRLPVACAITCAACVQGIVHWQAPPPTAEPVSHCNPAKAEVGIAQSAMNSLTTMAGASISSKHAVLIVPGEPMEVGSDIAAEAYASMPRVIKDGQYKSTFTKYVVVGHAEHPEGPQNIVVGDDVCEHSGFSDAKAVQYLRSSIRTALGPLSPPMANCKTSPEKCPEPFGPTFEQQMPYLDVLTNNSLKGNLLPVMIEGQSIALGAHVGDALGLLVGKSGVWSAERVLFVFGADFSVGLDATKAKSCDERTVQVVATEGVPNTASHFKQLWNGDPAMGDCGHKALPRSYSTILAAAKTAEILQLTATRTKVSRTAVPSFLGTAQDDADGAMLGYAHIIYWKDSRPKSEKVIRGNVLRKGGRKLR